jgi:hypothetical protein
LRDSGDFCYLCAKQEREMQKVSRILVAGLLTVLTGCASSSVMDVSSDTVIITTSADPSCGRTGAQDVASRRAAYEMSQDASLKP